MAARLTLADFDAARVALTAVLGPTRDHTRFEGVGAAVCLWSPRGPSVRVGVAMQLHDGELRLGGCDGDAKWEWPMVDVPAVVEEVRAWLAGRAPGGTVGEGES